MRILILDDDLPRGDVVVAARRVHADVRRARARDAVAVLERERADVVVVVSPPAAGADVPAIVATGVPVVVVGDRDAAEPAMVALRAGAADYVAVHDGDGGGALVEALGRLAARDGAGRHAPLAAGRRSADVAAGLVGRSPAMERVRELVRTAARIEAHVLIEGETGTGKEVVARAVHALGRRAAAPFVPVNCAAVPEALAESEFFGHARGAFTGAVQERPGVLQLADRGTLFLDEVEDLPPALQAKLLRVVQDREVRPLGGTVLRRVDVRILAASNRDLAAMVDAGTFRRDLYYRLRVFAIHLPPLRQRREDLPLLVGHFIARFNRLHGTAFAVPPPAALRPLVEHTWPGNVRELENVLEAICLQAAASGADPAGLLVASGVGTNGLIGDERARIVRVLDEHRWNRQRAAAALGISRVTLWRRMERHGIRDPLAAPATETA
jgi:DNA-binding NtrC family response regulator